jgi:hypothetical protein
MKFQNISVNHDNTNRLPRSRPMPFNRAIKNQFEPDNHLISHDTTESKKTSINSQTPPKNLHYHRYAQQCHAAVSLCIAIPFCALFIIPHATSLIEVLIILLVLQVQHIQFVFVPGTFAKHKRSIICLNIAGIAFVLAYSRNLLAKNSNSAFPKLFILLQNTKKC